MQTINIILLYVHVSQGPFLLVPIIGLLAPPFIKLTC